MQHLESACTDRVRKRFLPELERIALESLGGRSTAMPWMEFQMDDTTHSPVVLFHYPCNDRTGFEYLRRFVKIEFGSLTDQRPVGLHEVRPWAAEEFPRQFEDFRCQLVALELERTFWEKATILHMEYHRDKTKPLRDRFSRHYSDMAALANHPIAESALARQDLRQRVADWKSRFFPATWARYNLARPGTFRLAPPEFRLVELSRDYQAMRDMFITTPRSFDSIINAVSDLEYRINGRR
jgi:quinol monooxygenase YgiN